MGKRYQVLARRYRPQRFADVIGQESVLTTLKNALRFDQAAHAYLFCGSRGVGKTTLARLFAKALNCPNRGPDLEPCNQCPSCIEITSGQSLDVMEIDGASNRGIDDIRQINETVAYAPSHGKYKIYIIDEVHMLTKEAFNALLKTLEEPPEQAKFFFATTEAHKVLPTIVSRCQRFDLLRIGAGQIADKLAQIARDMNREVELEALHLIASFADGSLRDAESLFDQILCFASSDAIRADTVRQALGLISQEHFFDLDRAFSECRPAYAFELVEVLFQAGKDLSHFLEQLVEHYRRLCLCKTLGEKSLPIHLCDRYAAASRFYTQSQCLYILDTLIAAEQTMQKSPFPRVTLEATLLHVIRSKNRIPVEAIARRLIELEQTLKLPAPRQETDPEEEPQADLQPVPLNPYTPLEKPAPSAFAAEEKPRAPDSKTSAPSVFATPETLPPSALNAPSVFAEAPQARIHDMAPSALPEACIQHTAPSVLAESRPLEVPTVPERIQHTAPSVLAESRPLEVPTVPERIQHTAPSVLAESRPLEVPTVPERIQHAAPSVLAEPRPLKAPAAPERILQAPEPHATAKAEPTVLKNLGGAPSSPIQQKHPSHYETLMRFAAVELEGTLKI